MRKKFIVQLFAVMIALSLSAQVAFALYTQVEKLNAPDTDSKEDPVVIAAASPSPSPAPSSPANSSITGTAPISNSIVISEEVLTNIQSSDPEHYDKNLNNYKNLLSRLNVHQAFQVKIERLIQDGRPLPDILTAYEFVYHQSGMFQSVEQFVKQRQSGTMWETIFRSYTRSHPRFAPRAFEPELLESWMKTPGLTADDIMIADRISFESGKPVPQLLAAKNESKSWQEQNAELGIVFSASILPRVRVTAEQLDKFTKKFRMTEQQVVEAFVLADKLGLKPEDVVAKLGSGLAEEAVYAESYTIKYGSGV